MTDYLELFQRATQPGITRLDPDDTRVKAVRLKYANTKHLSRFGGAPNLPPTVAWPANPQGILLNFLLQIHFPEVPKHLGLPETGTLFLFYDYDKQPCDGMEDNEDYWKIIYTEEPLPQTATFPWKTNGKPITFHPRYMSFKVIDATIDDGPDDDLMLHGTSFLFGSSNYHQMLGYPFYLNVDDYVSGKLMLLRVDIDYDDNGMEWIWEKDLALQFWIDPQHLIDRDFSHVILCGDPI